MAQEPRLKILDVRRLDVTGTGVREFVIDAPVAATRCATHVIDLHGWILGESPIRELTVLENACDVRRIPLNVDRPDVRAAFPGLPAQTCGFQTFLAFLGANRTITYTLLAHTADGREVPLCQIDARLGSIGAPPEGLQPLMLTTLGRSGSTYVMGALARHPQIAAYRPFEYEARVSRYWVDVFAALAQPGSYLQSLVPAAVAAPEWWLGKGEKFHNTFLPDAQTMDFLATEGIEAVARLCLGRIDAFYRENARQENKADVRFYAEKCLPDREAALMRSLYPGRREVVLVRDLRDMICSILAFNRKRGFNGFGRENVQTDEQYMDYLRVSAQLLLDVVQSAANDRAVCLLRYEDFIQRPHVTLRTVLVFLGLDACDEVIEKMLAPVPQEVLALHRTSSDFAASIGRWRTEFTPTMKEAFRTHLEAVSLQLGYDPTDPLPADGGVGATA